MNKHMQIATLYLVMSSFLMPSCKNEGAASGGKKSQNASPIPCATPTPVVSNTPTPAPAAANTAAKLLAGVTYWQGVYPIVQKHCLSCHPAKPPGLSTYMEVKPIQQKVVSVPLASASDTNHRSLQLLSSEERTLQDWESGGFQEGDPGQLPTTPTAPAQPGATAPSASPLPDCTPAPAAPAGIDGLINSATKRQCDAQNQVTDRQGNRCFDAKIDMSWCTNAKTIAAHFSLRVTTQGLEAQIDSKIAGGFAIEQCGDSVTTPIVTFLKKIEAESRIETAVLQIQSKN